MARSISVRLDGIAPDVGSELAVGSERFAVTASLSTGRTPGTGRARSFTVTPAFDGSAVGLVSACVRSERVKTATLTVRGNEPEPLVTHELSDTLVASVVIAGSSTSPRPSMEVMLLGAVVRSKAGSSEAEGRP